jgi:hypothetical protein
MNGPVVMYGYSRGYRILAVLSGLVLLTLAATLVKAPFSATAVTIVGLLAFGVLFVHAVQRGLGRSVVLTMSVDGFELHDPALPQVLLRWEMLEEIRIYATLRHPRVGFGLVDTDPFFRGVPFLYRPVFHLGRQFQQYPVVIQLDDTEHQISAIQSAAQRHRVPVRTELA